MKWFIIVLAVLILLCFIMLITKLSIRITVFYTAGEQHVYVQIRIWFMRYTLDVLQFLEKRKAKEQEKSDTKQEEELERPLSEWLEKLPDLIKSFGDIHTIIKGFLKKVKLRHLKWHTHFGAGDAASTGILTGSLWSIKGIIAGIISSYMNMVKTPDLNITPIFQGRGIATQLECMISFRIGQAMLAALKLLRYIRKNRSILIKAKQTANVRG
ncbi:MAG: DUF2953 domain-containing protein [Ectobacillus sp.]